MKVLIIRNPAAQFGCCLREGEVGDISDDLGKILVAKGLAECLDPPPAPTPKVELKAVPPEPEIVEAKPPVTVVPGASLLPLKEDPSVADAEGTLRGYVDKQKRKPKQKES